MADLKRRIGVKGKYSAVHRGQGNASPLANSAVAKSLRPETTDKKRRRDLPSSTRPRKNTVHSPISGLDEPAPGSEIAPSDEGEQNTPIPEEVRPEFLDGVAGAETEQPNNALDADIQRDANSLDDVSKAEASADKNDGQDSEQNDKEKEFIDKDGTSGNKDEETGFQYISNLRTRMSTRKKIIIASTVMSIATLVVGFFIMLPNFLIFQAKDLLLGKLSDMSTRQQLRYRRTKIARVSDIFSRDGRIGSRIISEMESKGYTFRFEDPTDNNRITKLVTPGGTILDVENGQAGEHLSAYMEARHPLRTSRWKTRRMEAFIGRYGISRIPPTVRAPDSPDDPNAAVNKNMANQTEVDEVETRGVKETPPDDASDEDIASQDEIANNTENSDIFEVNKQSLKETGEVADPEALKISEYVPDGVQPELHAVAEDLADGGSLGGKAIDGVKQLTLSGITDRICTIKNRLRAGFTSARTYRALAAMKQMMQVVNVADGLKLKKGDAKMFASYMKRFTATDSNGVPIGGSNGFSYVLKGTFNKARNDEVKSRIGVDGKPSGFIGGVWNSLSFPGTSAEACGRWQNPITQIGLTIIEVGIGFFTGGSSKAITTGGIKGAMEAVKQSIKNATVRTIAKSVARNIAKTAVVELSFEGVMQLTQLYAEKSMTDNFSSLEVGGMFGEIVTAGGGVARKQRDLEAGFVPATKTQYEDAHDKYIAELREERSKQSFATRIFDIYNTDSLVSQIVWQAPLDVPTATNMVGERLYSLSTGPSATIHTLTKLISPSVSAQEEEIIADTFIVEEGDANDGLELATDPAGNVMTILRDDIAAIDPTENIEYLQTNNYIDSELEPIGLFEEHVEKCVRNIDTLSIIEGGNPENPAEDCMASLDITVRFKAHLAYLDMFDGVESIYAPETIDEGQLDEEGSDSILPSGPVDCSSAVGNQKIVCAAEQYSGIRYSNGGDKWNEEWGVLNTNGRLNGGASAASWLQTRVPGGYGDFLDCSGYTNLSLYVAYGYRTTAGCSGYYVRDTNGDGLSDADPNLKIIPINEVQPGDFLTISQNCNGETAGHIGIFAGILPSGEWSTLESSAGRNVNGEKRSGYYARPPGGGTGEHDFKYAARYIGPGSEL